MALAKSLLNLGSTFLGTGVDDRIESTLQGTSSGANIARAAHPTLCGMHVAFGVFVGCVFKWIAVQTQSERVKRHPPQALMGDLTCNEYTTTSESDGIVMEVRPIYAEHSING